MRRSLAAILLSLPVAGDLFGARFDVEALSNRFSLLFGKSSLVFPIPDRFGLDANCDLASAHCKKQNTNFNS